MQIGCCCWNNAHGWTWIAKMIIRIIYLLGASIVTIIQFETVSKEQKLSEYILGFPSLGIITLEERHLF